MDPSPPTTGPATFRELPLVSSGCRQETRGDARIARIPLTVSVLNGNYVRPTVQAIGLEPGPVRGAFNGLATILVGLCRSESSWRHTNCPSLANVTPLREVTARRASLCLIEYNRWPRQNRIPSRAWKR